MKIDFPVYQMDKHGLYAFVSKDKMFMVTNSHGSNAKNSGMVVDHYITERMVKKLYSDYRTNISEDRFIKLFNELTGRVLDKIINF